MLKILVRKKDHWAGLLVLDCLTPHVPTYQREGAGGDQKEHTNVKEMSAFACEVKTKTAKMTRPEI